MIAVVAVHVLRVAYERNNNCIGLRLRCHARHYVCVCVRSNIAIVLTAATIVRANDSAHVSVCHDDENVESRKNGKAPNTRAQLNSMLLRFVQAL